MKSAEALYDMFQERTGKLNLIIRQVAQGNYRGKDLLALRIHIKKIRTILLLLQLAGAPEFDGKRRIRFIKPVFKKSGIIREYLVRLKGLNNYWLSSQSKKAFAQQVKSEIKTNKKALLKSARHFESEKLEKLTEKAKGICINTAVSTLRKKARVFVAEIINQINQLILNGPATEDLHPIRIHLRHITTLAVLFRELGMPVMPQKRLKQLKQIQRLLGDWHDHEELTGAVERFKTGVPEPVQQREWEVLLGKLKVENEEQIDALKLALAAF